MSKKEMSQMITIGIDPGVHTGYAEAENGKLRMVKTTNFHDVLEFIESNYKPHQARIIIEISRTTHTWHLIGKMTKQAAAKIGQNVGAVRREAELLAEKLQILGFAVQGVEPKGKLDSAKFNRITGYTGRSNQHERDAGMLAFIYSR